MADFPENRRPSRYDGTDIALGLLGMVFIVMWVVAVIMIITGLVQHDAWQVSWGVVIFIVPFLGRLFR